MDSKHSLIGGMEELTSVEVLFVSTALKMLYSFDRILISISVKLSILFRIQDRLTVFSKLSLTLFILVWWFSFFLFLDWAFLYSFSNLLALALRSFSSLLASALHSYSSLLASALYSFSALYFFSASALHSFLASDLHSFSEAYHLFLFLN